MRRPGAAEELHKRARRMVEVLEEYEAKHPRRGPDREGRQYDPWHEVIVDPFDDGSLEPRQEIDHARTNAIAARIWEGFAWASHRFVLSDEQGNCVIVGYNENAGRWFVDNTTPVRLPAAWVAEFMVNWDAEGQVTGFENPRTVHDAIVQSVGSLLTTIPSIDEVAEYLDTRRAEEPQVAG